MAVQFGCGFSSFAYLVIYLTLVLQGRRGLACMCLPEHPQEQFCRADFVIRGKVLPKSSTELPETEGSAAMESDLSRLMGGAEIYDIQVEKVFKGEVILGVLRHNRISMVRYGASCGQALEEGKVYFLTGQYLPHAEYNFQIGMCDWVANHKTLSRKQRQGVRHLYKQYCSSCKIEKCFHGECRTAAASNVCTWDPTNVMKGDIDCEGLYSRCMRKSDGSCKWYENTSMKDCMRRRDRMKDNSIQ